MIVADTNLILALCLWGENTRIAEDVFKKDPGWAAPLLWRSEFRNALVTYIRRGSIGFETAALIADEAERLMEENEYEVNSADVLSLAARSGCSAYDCEFVALARELRVPLVTLDKDILAAFPEIAIPLGDFAKR